MPVFTVLMITSSYPDVYPTVHWVVVFGHWLCIVELPGGTEVAAVEVCVLEF